VGIQPNNFDSSVRLAGGMVAVLEGDEYRSSRLDTSSKFSHYKPDVAVITSIEMDHPDLFADLAAVRERFIGLVKGLPTDGKLFYWNGEAEVKDVAKRSNAPTVSYDLENADWTATNAAYTPNGIEFNLVEQGNDHGRLQVPTYGEHNVLNALAASAVTLSEGISVEQLQAGVKTFKGASRRFERVSAPDAEVTVIDDYAHHPTEVAATINAAKRHFSGKVIAVFRPHTFSRTAALLAEYQMAFEEADKAYIADIEAAREQDEPAGERVSSAQIAEGAGPNVVYEPDRTKLIESAVAEAKPGDVVLCMTVSGYNGLAQELAKRLG
jgi:UDP-N-acetylmuramate-alanine ligase